MVSAAMMKPIALKRRPNRSAAQPQTKTADDVAGELPRDQLPGDGGREAALYHARPPAAVPPGDEKTRRTLRLAGVSEWWA